MIRAFSTILSGAFHAGAAGAMILIGVGGHHAPLPVAPVSFPPTQPLAVDVVDRRVETDFIRPEELPLPPDLPVEVSLEFDPAREPVEPVDPEPLRPLPFRPAPSFERPLAASVAAVRLPEPPPAAQAAVEAETSPAEIHNPPPEYPFAARRRGLEGEALVEVSILPDGRCGEARLLECTGSPLFGESALKAVEAWRYRPATRNGRPVESRQTIRFVFRLRA